MGIFPSIIFRNSPKSTIANRAYWFNCPYGRAWLDHLIENGAAAGDPSHPAQQTYIKLRELAKDGAGKGSIHSFQSDVQNRMRQYQSEDSDGA